jgi:hypothetical protein
LNRRSGFTVGKGAYDVPVPGLLKASITPAKNLKRLGPSVYALKVGPRGQRAHLYAQKAEGKYGYMQAGENVAKAALKVTAEAAFNKVWVE